MVALRDDEAVADLAVEELLLVTLFDFLVVEVAAFLEVEGLVVSQEVPEAEVLRTVCADALDLSVFLALLFPVDSRAWLRVLFLLFAAEALILFVAFSVLALFDTADLPDVVTLLLVSICAAFALAYWFFPLDNSSGFE